MDMLKDKLQAFKHNTKAFFKTPEGGWNRQAVIAILIGGFVGWLVITITFGARLKKMLRKVPGIKMLFGTTRRVVRRTASTAKRRMYKRK